MPRKEEWISAEAAAIILTAHSGHTISGRYVRQLAAWGKIASRAKNKRENEYLKQDVESLRIQQRKGKMINSTNPRMGWIKIECLGMAYIHEYDPDSLTARCMINGKMHNLAWNGSAWVEQKEGE